MKELSGVAKSALQAIKLEGYSPIGVYETSAGIGGFIYNTEAESTKHMNEATTLYCSWYLEEFKRDATINTDDIIWLDEAQGIETAAQL